MNIHFFQPPPDQRIGGLDAAIGSLNAALRADGHAVDERLDGAGVVHFHGLWQRAFPSLARECRQTGVPYVVSPHGMLEPWAWRHKRWKKWPYFHAIERRWISRAACILATAPGEAERLREFFPRTRVEWLPLGMTGDAGPDHENARTRLGWRTDERVLLYLSRIHEKKGLDLLLQALARISPREKVRLAIVGDGEPAYMAKIHSLAESLAAKLPPVEFIGPVWGDARWTYFQGADLFCLPTHSENFGLAVLEACQVGTPALTTTATPWGTLLGDERGLICEPRVESIEAALRTYLAGSGNPLPNRQDLARWSRENFAWSTLAPRYAALYESLRP